MTGDSRRKKHFSYRSARRLKSHDEAHAVDMPMPPILDHGMVPQRGPSLINSVDALNGHVQLLREGGRFAFDTEFIGERSYHAQVCLIQTATASDVFLIDPLASAIDISCMWGLLADDSVLKIVHAGEQDLEPVLRHVGKPPANVVDTQILAAFGGSGYPVGMRTLVRELFGAELGHPLTFTQWDHRPLSQVQTHYAGNDVRYLLLLYECLIEKVRASGNEAWALEECRSLCSPERFRFDPHAQRSRMRGVDGLSPRQLMVLAELIAWRERSAESEDVPPRSLVKDSILIDMTHNPPASVDDLDRVSGLPRPVENRWGHEIIAAIERGSDAAIPDGMIDKPYDRWAHRKKIDQLWSKAVERCEMKGIAPTLAISKREVGSYLRALELGVPREQAAGRLIKSWRGELFGDVIESNAVA